MDDRRLLSDPIGIANVNHVRVPIPGNHDRCCWMVPANIYSSDFRPVGGDLDGFFSNKVVCDRKYSSRTQDGNASDPSISLMRRICCNDRGPSFLWDMYRIIELHSRHMTTHLVAPTTQATTPITNTRATKIARDLSSQ